MIESPIFTRTYDLLQWLIPATVKFPRAHRFVLAEAVQRAALQFQEEILEAAYSGRRPQASLQRADVSLTKLRLYLRLCHDLDLLSRGQYEHVSNKVDEIGRLLGGWRKKDKKAKETQESAEELR
jgi:four helix bundle protein